MQTVNNIMYVSSHNMTVTACHKAKLGVGASAQQHTARQILDKIGQRHLKLTQGI